MIPDKSKSVRVVFVYSTFLTIFAHSSPSLLFRMKQSIMSNIVTMFFITQIQTGEYCVLL